MLKPLKLGAKAGKYTRVKPHSAVVSNLWAMTCDFLQWVRESVHAPSTVILIFI
jgi:hypothetical protein